MRTKFLIHVYCSANVSFLFSFFLLNLNTINTYTTHTLYGHLNVLTATSVYRLKLVWTFKNIDTLYDDYIYVMEDWSRKQFTYFFLSTEKKQQKQKQSDFYLYAKVKHILQMANCTIHFILGHNIRIQQTTETSQVINMFILFLQQWDAIFRYS